MPRVAQRRKASSEETIDAATTNNNNAGESETKLKRGRNNFIMRLPERPHVVGRALVCGQGDMGQLGLGDDESKFERKRPAMVESIPNVVDVVAGGMHNLVLTNEGRVFSFGCNDEGALGRDSGEDGSEFVPKEIDLPGKVLKISAGDSHSACLLDDGRVFAWGSFRDSHGNMGLTLEGNKRLPIDVLPDMKCCDIASGADHLAILTCNGKVYTVGCGEQGQLGRVSMRSASGEGRRGKTELLRPNLVIIKRGKAIEAIWASNYCTFMRECVSGTIFACGLNNYKQLAIAKDLTTIVTPIATSFENIKQIAGGQQHTLVLKNDGSCYVIGKRDYGRLGLGNLPDDVSELLPIRALKDLKIMSIACGEAQSFAITQEGKLYSWGMGSNLQLGTGSEDDALEPVLIVSKQTENKRIIRAASGGQHSIFLVEDEVQPRPVAAKESKAVVEKPAKKNSTAAVPAKKAKLATGAAAAVVEPATSTTEGEADASQSATESNDDVEMSNDDKEDEAANTSESKEEVKEEPKAAPKGRGRKKK